MSTTRAMRLTRLVCCCTLSSRALGEKSGVRQVEHDCAEEPDGRALGHGDPPVVGVGGQSVEIIAECVRGNYEEHKRESDAAHERADVLVAATVRAHEVDGRQNAEGERPPDGARHWIHIRGEDADGRDDETPGCKICCDACKGRIHSGRNY